MRVALITVSLLAAALPCLAAQSLTTTAVSCAAIHAAVERERSVLLRYAAQSGRPVYDLAVANSQHCAGGGSKTVSFPALDLAACPVLVCVPVSDLRP